MDVQIVALTNMLDFPIRPKDNGEKRWSCEVTRDLLAPDQIESDELSPPGCMIASTPSIPSLRLNCHCLSVMPAPPGAAEADSGGFGIAVGLGRVTGKFGRCPGQFSVYLFPGAILRPGAR
jgi:hypothetical protein